MHVMFHASAVPRRAGWPFAFGINHLGHARGYASGRRPPKYIRFVQRRWGLVKFLFAFNDLAEAAAEGR
ncbi:MAG: hypothetical protein ABI409_01255, partial [Ramlibacter sp.]